MNIVDNRNFTLLTYASDRNFEHCFRILYDHAVIHNIKDSEEIRKVRLKEWINTQTSEGDTALHFASYYGNKELLDLMIKFIGADVNIRNN